LEQTDRPLKDRTRCRVHVGTTEALANIRLLESNQLLPGETMLAQLFLAEPIAVTWNQPFVIRSESPVTTLGGGQILDPTASRLKQVTDTQKENIRRLLSPQVVERAIAAAYLAGLKGIESRDLARAVGADQPELVFQQLLETKRLVRIQLSPTRTIHLHADVIAELAERIVKALGLKHDANPLQVGFDKVSFLSQFQYLGEAPIIDALVQQLQREKKINVDARSISLVGKGPKLSQGEQQLYRQIIDWYKTSGLETPSIAECRERAVKNRESVPQLIKLAIANGELAEVTNEYFLHQETAAGIRESLFREFSTRPSMTMAEIRDILKTTRKYAVPLCEYFDRIGLTKRIGDLRQWVGSNNS
jgi:selenocysteine-specific elongation factor